MDVFTTFQDSVYVLSVRARGALAKVQRCATLQLAEESVDPSDELTAMVSDMLDTSVTLEPVDQFYSVGVYEVRQDTLTHYCKRSDLIRPRFVFADEQEATHYLHMYECLREVGVYPEQSKFCIQLNADQEWFLLGIMPVLSSVRLLDALLRSNECYEKQARAHEVLQQAGETPYVDYAWHNWGLCDGELYLHDLHMGAQIIERNF